MPLPQRGLQLRWHNEATRVPHHRLARLAVYHKGYPGLRDGRHSVSLQLRDGFNFLIVDHMVDKEGTTATSTTGVFLFLLNVAHQPFGRAISVFCIDPHCTYDGQGTSSNTLKYLVTYWRWFHKRQLKLYHSLSSELSVESTDLSNGLPNTDECFKLVVPNSALGDGEKEAIHVKVRFTIC